MAIPTKPLTIKAFDPKQATLDELALFLAPDELTPGEQVAIFRRFCIDHTDWSRREVGALTLNEIQEVAKEIGKKLEEISVPKATPDS